ncbi:elongation of very long chain fatty acids protein AAEL008004-like [Ischnura elegans]|uniref:elongation of very long chain fatty acids protein AAEL008004-like n=1 Tax=Ischnura elegans TaxID=197161 RepID=UPI001ED8946A|nr:elongation of very long chain fatty acids protein AAEL008004-like [Ischnura elegans]
MDTANDTLASSGLLELYMELMHNKSDPRVQDWPLMSSPLPTLLICMSYVYFVKWLGPRLMHHQKSFNMRGVLAFYNVFQVSYNAWLFYEGVTIWTRNRYNFRCQPVDYSNTPAAKHIAAMCWWYYICKLTEFFDTISFVLRKKNDHISWLHVIHHGTMPLSVWFGVKFTPGGHSIFFGMLNTFVHIMMYSYYFLASLGPKYQKYIWWKKYLTTLQMTHFVLIMLHSFQLLFRENCEYPVFFVWWIGCHAILFYVFFTGFFKEKYGKASHELRTSQQVSKKKE